jgi:magnesium-transporting ATPase (P-type)
MMFFLAQAVYQGYNGFTGTSLFEYWSGSVINVIFTALCIIFLGMFEQDLDANTLLAVPELYAQGQRNGSFNLWIYAWWNFMALTDAVLIYYFVYLAYGMALFNDVFTDAADLFAFGQLQFAVCVVVINTKLLYVLLVAIPLTFPDAPKFHPLPQSLTITATLKCTTKPSYPPSAISVALADGGRGISSSTKSTSHPRAFMMSKITS